eukprot:4213971-Prymnesium_polylepis.1
MSAWQTIPAQVGSNSLSVPRKAITGDPDPTRVKNAPSPHRHAYPPAPRRRHSGKCPKHASGRAPRCANTS